LVYIRTCEISTEVSAGEGSGVGVGVGVKIRVSVGEPVFDCVKQPAKVRVPKLPIVVKKIRRFTAPERCQIHK